MNTQEQIEQWLAQLNDYRRRREARKQLFQLGPAAVAERLMQLIGNPETGENARWAALVILGEFGWQPAIPALLEVMRTSPALRGQACQSLKAITGLNLLADVPAWEAALGLKPSSEPLPAETPVAAAAPPPDFHMLQAAMAGTGSELRWEPAGYAYLRCHLAGDRTQQVVVTLELEVKSGQEQFVIYTECGLPSPQVREIIDRRNFTLRYGRFFLEPQTDGSSMVTLRYRLPKSKASPERLREVLLYIAQEADFLEYEMNHTDAI